MPPPNVPFWHKDYFELKSTENKQIAEKLSDFYLLKSSTKICKNNDHIPLPTRKERVNHSRRL